MEIIIGREEGTRRIRCIADGREFFVGQAGMVPQSVSRQHCRLTVMGDAITIENIKPQNVTYVDGNQVNNKSITPTSKVQLGVERFVLPLQQILQLATGRTGTGQQPQTFSLRPLRSVWEDYDNRKLEIQQKAARAANLSRLQGILSMCGMCVGFIPGIDQTVRIVIIVLALAVAIYFFYKGMSDNSVPMQLRKLDNELADKYKCPNPDCGKPFGTVPYRQIEFSKQCFACGCKYTH